MSSLNALPEYEWEMVSICLFLFEYKSVKKQHCKMKDARVLSEKGESSRSKCFLVCAAIYLFTMFYVWSSNSIHFGAVDDNVLIIKYFRLIKFRLRGVAKQINESLFECY